MPRVFALALSLAPTKTTSPVTFIHCNVSDQKRVTTLMALLLNRYTELEVEGFRT